MVIVPSRNELLVFPVRQQFYENAGTIIAPQWLNPSGGE